MLAHFRYVIIAVLFLYHDAFANVYFGNYKFTPRGSAKYVALAGATIAHPSNPSAYTENVSSIPFQLSSFSLSLASGTSTDKRTVVAESKVTKDDFFSLGVNGVLNNSFGIAAGLETEDYFLEKQETSQSTLGYNFQQSNIPFGFSVRIYDQLSLGFSYIPTQTLLKRLRSEFSSDLEEQATIKYSGGRNKLSGTFALSNNIAFGATYTPDLSMKQSEANGIQDNATSFYIPATAQLGTAYFMNGPEMLATTEFPLNFTFYLQGDLVHFPELSSDSQVYSPALLLDEVNPKTIQVSSPSDTGAAEFDTRSPKFIPKFGVETEIYKTKNISTTGWLGMYYEPVLMKASQGYQHLTAGAEVMLWFFIVRYGIDVAENYTNQGLGLGIGVSY